MEGTEGVYVAFEAATNKLRFYDGTIYEMGCVSGSGEPDAGTRHVTRVIDPNGNYFTLTYLAGAGGGGPNTSARINTAVDVTRINGISESPIYFMHYGYLQIGVNAAEPHFRQLFFTSAAVTTPWGTPAGTQRLLTSIYGTYGANHTLQYTGFGELNTVTFPYGGRLRWEHRAFTFSTGRTIREVNWRGLIQIPGGAETHHVFTRDDAGDAGQPRHFMLVITPQDGLSVRAWTYDLVTGRPSTFIERQNPSTTILVRKQYSWTSNSKGHPYISEVLTTVDWRTPSQGQSKVTQVVDGDGNVVQQKEYDFDLSEANARIYTHVYASYGSTYYRRFLQSTTVQQGSWSRVLVNNQYFLGYPFTYVNESTLRLWDSSYKMNHPKHLVAHDRPGHSARFTYYPTGDVSSATVNGLVQANTLNAQLSAPTQIAASGLSTTLNWNSVLQLTSEVGPNGDTVSFNWSADRPTQTTSPHGAQTNYTYSYSPARTEAKTGNRWTRSYYDGLGRTVRVENGYTSGGDIIDGIVLTEYGPCACSPAGKVKRVSQPHRPGQTPVWTTYDYDAAGRVTAVTHPPNTGTTGNSGVTRYAYSGNQVTVTDPRGNWKRYQSDAFGNLTHVWEPRPGGGEYLTTYAYNPVNQLTLVNTTRDGVTQQRIFAYNNDLRLESTTFPENGTTRYTYNAQGDVGTRTDAKNQVISYAYHPGTRLVATMGGASFYYGGALPSGVTTDFQFTYSAGRISAVYYGNGISEFYAYTRGGLLAKKRLNMGAIAYNAQLQTWPDELEASATYDGEGRMLTLQPPKMPSHWRNLRYSYDAMGRPAKATMDILDYFDGQYEPTWRATDMAAGTVYGPAGEMLQMTRWVSYNPTRYETQTWSYNNRLQLTATSNNSWPSGLHGREYRYSATANDGRIESMRDMGTGEEIVYQYDSLQRLIQAATVAGPSPWSQGYSYDGFGNLYRRTGTGAAALFASDYSAQLNSWTNRIGATDANGNSTAGGTTYDFKNRIASYSTGLATFSMTYSPLDNKRVVRTSSQDPEWTVYFYFGNYLLASNRLKFDTQRNWRYWAGNSRIWIPFAGRRLEVLDRLGSNLTERYLPYGEELSTGGTDAFKWAEYYRDPGGLDYADQRHYSAKLGRFLTADPYDGSAALTNPGSWNRYAYVSGDPVNKSDPTGLFEQGPGPGPGVEMYAAMYCAMIYGQSGYVGFPPEFCHRFITPYRGGGEGPSPPAPPSAPELCGINPVTGEGGINPRQSGEPGELRPGRGGRGFFGARRNGGRTHQGLDIAGSIGAPVVSAYAGKVTFAGQAGGYGNLIIVDVGHGYTMRYSHLASMGVQAGDVLEMGQSLGTLGQTGNAAGQPASEAHVHFEIRNGTTPVDPRSFLNSICPW